MTYSPESSLSDDDTQVSSKTRRSGIFYFYLSILVKHSISEKKRVIRFNQCVDSFMEMLSVFITSLFHIRATVFMFDETNLVYSLKLSV